MGNLLDCLDPIVDNVPILWDQFLTEFCTQYQDTQHENRIHAQIETHWMKFPDIDQYISSFEELASTAGYTQGDEVMTHYFVKGLTPSIMIDIYKLPTPCTYEDIKQCAINSTCLRMLINGQVYRPRMRAWTTPLLSHLQPTTRPSLLPAATATAAEEAISGPTTIVYIVKHTEMDEQCPHPDGYGKNKGTDMAWMRKHLQSGNAANPESNHLLPVWKGRALHPELRLAI